MVVGHRGVPALHQENSIAGFRRALSLGIDAIELDVRLTRDSRLVVCHDEDLERLTGEKLQLSKLTWDQVSKLRIRRTLSMGTDAFGADVVVEYDQAERIPLLEEVADEVGSKLATNVELKLDTAPWWRARIGRLVAEQIEGTDFASKAILTSFDIRKLRSAKRAAPSLAVGFCYDDSMLDIFARVLARNRRLSILGHGIRRRFSSLFLRDQVVGADHTLVGTREVSAMKQAGMAIGCHTLFPIGSTTGKAIDPRASSSAEVERLVSLGVDWIESDDPERLLKELSRLDD